jgi:hypothetical protein
VSNESDDGSSAVESRRALRRRVDVPRPRCARLDEHPRHGGERLRREHRRIEKSSAVPMIAALQDESPGVMVDRSAARAPETRRLRRCDGRKSDDGARG